MNIKAIKMTPENLPLLLACHIVMNDKANCKSVEGYGSDKHDPSEIDTLIIEYVAHEAQIPVNECDRELASIILAGINDVCLLNMDDRQREPLKRVIFAHMVFNGAPHICAVAPFDADYFSYMPTFSNHVNGGCGGGVCPVCKLSGDMVEALQGRIWPRLSERDLDSMASLWSFTQTAFKEIPG